MKAIQKELGEGTEIQEEVRIYQDKLRKIRVPDEVKEELEKQISRLAQMPPRNRPETSVAATTSTGCSCCRGTRPRSDTLDPRKARRSSRGPTTGWRRFKEAASSSTSASASSPRRPRAHSSASSARPAWADSLGQVHRPGPGRKFGPISLGGVHDEAEIAPPPTYVGAMPAASSRASPGRHGEPRLHDGPRSTKSGPIPRRPVVGGSSKSSTPSEQPVPRPLLGVPYDLSKVNVITTANLLRSHPAGFPATAMEVAGAARLHEEEKLHIARPPPHPQAARRERPEGPKLIAFHGRRDQEADLALHAGSGGPQPSSGDRSIWPQVVRKVAEGKKAQTVIHGPVGRAPPRPRRSSRPAPEERTRSGSPPACLDGRRRRDMFVEATKMPGKGALLR